MSSFKIINKIRNVARKTKVGRQWLANLDRSCQPEICFVSATKLNEFEFWHHSYLGPSLKPLLEENFIKCKVFYNNKIGLASIYNTAINECTSDIIVFIHDDVWLADDQLPQKIIFSTRQFDIVGVAGNKKPSTARITWFCDRVDANGKFIGDQKHLSGIVSHGNPDNHEISFFGETPSECLVLDGVFIAARTATLLSSKVKFDERFKFHFYDLDFCASAKEAGLQLGTWPIDLIHQSTGNYQSSAWREGLTTYHAKWKR